MPASPYSRRADLWPSPHPRAGITDPTVTIDARPADAYRAVIADAHRWKNTRCVVCDLPFPTWAEWGDRHDTDAGPAHPDCCEVC